MLVLVIFICVALLSGAYIALAPGHSDGIAKFFAGLLLLISATFFLITVPFYIGSIVEADVLNRELGTSYTADNVFYAEDTIYKVHGLNRTRIEVNEINSLNSGTAE